MKGAANFLISVVKLERKQMATSFSHTNRLNLLVSRFVVAQSLKQQSADAQSSLFHTNLGIKFCALRFHCSSHIPDEKGVSHRKFKSNHQTFSAGGAWTAGHVVLFPGLYHLNHFQCAIPRRKVLSCAVISCTAGQTEGRHMAMTVPDCYNSFIIHRRPV